MAFTLQNPAVATVLFGATTPAQIEQNVAALGLEARLSRRDPPSSLRSGRERQWTASGSWLGSQPVTMYRTRSPMFTRVVADALVEAGDEGQLHGDLERRCCSAAWLSKIACDELDLQPVEEIVDVVERRSARRDVAST